jgi:hypothetical protein
MGNKIWLLSNELLFGIKKKLYSNTYHSMDKLGKITPRERSQTQKSIYCMILFIEMSEIGKSIVTESGLGFASGGGREE